MFKQLKVTEGGIYLPITIRNYEENDFASLIALQALSFPPPFPADLWWKEEQLKEHIYRFPEGALCAVHECEIVGSITSLRTSLHKEDDQDWAFVTDNGYIRNHDPQGETLYIVDICVAPMYRKFGIGKWLMQSMYETVVHLKCRRLLGGGRMPGYGAVADSLTPEQYVEMVSTGELKDPVLTFLVRSGRLPIGIVANYIDDEESKHYAALMEWRNPFLVHEFI